MFPIRHTCVRIAAVALLLAAGAAGAQTKTFAPSVIGKPVVLEGQLEVVFEDYADGHSTLRHFLKTPQERIELKFAGKPPQLQSGARVRVRGQAQADVLALDGSAGSIEPLTTVLPNTMGEQSIAVLLVNFQDDASQPKTVAEAQNLVFGDTSNHYLQSSFGQTWFKGQTFGWFTIAMSKTACDPYQLANLADAKAAQAGVKLGDYQRRVYMFPANACQWLGLGVVGGNNTQAWANGAMTLQVVGHELGHNYGLYHAHSLDCDTGVYGQDCIRYNYGDAADLMGNNRPGQFNPFEKERLGWLNDGISPPITTVTTGGRYSIEPYSASTVGPKAIKIRRGTDPLGNKLWFYVEYRQPIGGDSVLANTGNVTQGVMVRTATEGDPDSSYQLDMSPGSSTQYFYEAADGALAVGQSHYDPDSGVTLTLVSTDANGADIDVQFGAPTCTRAAPEVWVGPNRSAVAGTAVEYELQVANHDSIACPATTFALNGIVPTGWTGTPGMAALTVKPGMTGYTTLNVTSPTSAALGQYKIWAATTSPDSALHTAQSVLQAYYGVIPPCTRAAPSVSLTGGGTGVLAGARVPYVLTVTNRDGSSCESTSFSLASSVPAGWTGTLHATSVALGPGQTASVGLDVVSNTAAPVGSYGIGVAASSAVGVQHTANASAIYDVASTCTRVAPMVSLTGGGAVVAPGTTVTYTLSISNRDSSGCPATGFVLARSAPAGWASTLSRTSIALAPGASDSAVLNVTSPTTAVGGSYGIGTAVSSPLGALHTASVSTTYVVTPKLAIADASIVEGNTGTKTANFTVSLAKPTVVPVTFNIATTNGTAAAGSDYTATSRVGVTIPQGSTSAIVSVPVNGDAAVEGNETFYVNVSGVKGAILADAQAVGTIRNDDTVLSIADASVAEGNSGTKTLTFTVKLSVASASPVTFNLATANKTAAAGTDYAALALAGRSIPAGTTSKVFNVTIKGDIAKEANETFVVNLASVTGATVGDAQALGTIVNDD